MNICSTSDYDSKSDLDLGKGTKLTKNQDSCSDVLYGHCNVSLAKDIMLRQKVTDFITGFDHL